MEEKRIELSDDYMFSTIIREDKEICRKVLENILGFEIEDLEYVKDELRELITYIEKPEEARKSLTSELVVELDEKVTSQNKDEDWREAQMKAEADRVDYIDYGIAVGMEEGLARGRSEGRAEGRTAGKAEGYSIARQVFKLSLAGKSVEQIAQELGLDESEVSMILG